VWTVSCPLCHAHLKAQRANCLAPKATLQRGRYVIDQTISRTDYDITYRAFQTRPERIVVIKEFYVKHMSYRRTPAGLVGYRQGIARFLTEAERMAAIRHPNIAGVHGIFEENGTAYQVRDYLRGRSLYAEMTTEEPESTTASREWYLRALSEERIETIFDAVSDALAAAHTRKVYHLDIQPKNILMLVDGRVALTDFDVSRRALFWDLPETTPFSPYAAPEVIMGMRVGPESDVYSLGALLYQLLTARMPPGPADRDSKAAALFGLRPTSLPGSESPVSSLEAKETSVLGASAVPHQPVGGPQPRPWRPLDVPHIYRARISAALSIPQEDRPKDVAGWWQS
jgi:serine/threonine protein kinase